jgi:predicted GH43/DUF377 family glycosyl hydrolase
MTDESTWVRRSTQALLADPHRVITRLYLPGQEILEDGILRADSVIDRVLGMTDEEVSTILGEIIGKYADRHFDLRAVLVENYGRVAHRLAHGVEISPDRRDLIGSFFTKEYAIEAAALFNPSMVPHPDQSGLAVDELRFIMSVRAVGEGHISSIEFRTGVISGEEIRIDDPGRYLVAGRAAPATMSREFLRDALAERGDATAAKQLLSLLPDEFDAKHLGAAIISIEEDELTRDHAREVIKEIRWIASCNYRLDFPFDRALSERVLYPTSVDETHGMEDARFTRFTEDDGQVNYWATYTAYDGARVKPHLIHTADFQTFDITRLIGPAAKNKGMAMFPRRIKGEYLALSRWDQENISIATSSDTRSWGEAVEILIPEQPWEFVQLGNCGPPIETPEGWLVVTHGVGPMREYGIGAILLDIDDPTKVIGALSQPILCAEADERDGYTPNVVYSCGALIHKAKLVIPYGCSDASIRFAFVDVPELMKQLHTSW